MAVTLESLGIDKLPREERLILVQQIWDSIAAETPSPLSISEELRHELELRAAEDDADPEGRIPWEQAKAEILARLAKG